MTDKNKVLELTEALRVLFKERDCNLSDATQACVTMLLAITMYGGRTQQEASERIAAYLKAAARMLS